MTLSNSKKALLLGAHWVAQLPDAMQEAMGAACVIVAISKRGAAWISEGGHVFERVDTVARLFDYLRELTRDYWADAEEIDNYTAAELDDMRAMDPPAVV